MEMLLLKRVVLLLIIALVFVVTLDGNMVHPSCKIVWRTERAPNITWCLVNAKRFQGNLVTRSELKKTCTGWKCETKPQENGRLEFTHNDGCADRYSHVLHDKKIPWGITDRAMKTTPPGFSIRPSVIPDAGLGAFTNVRIPKGTILGEYEGDVEVLMMSKSHSYYNWMVRSIHPRDRSRLMDAYLVNAGDPRTSNWLRYVNCARTPQELNAHPLFCRGKVFYAASRDVEAGEELMVYYGDSFAESLGIDSTLFCTVT